MNSAMWPNLAFDDTDLALLEVQRPDDLVVRRLLEEIRRLRDELACAEARVSDLNRERCELERQVDVLEGRLADIDEVDEGDS